MMLAQLDDSLPDWMRSRKMAILFGSFALIIVLAITGTVLAWAFGMDNGLISDAMRIIGIGGPAGAGTQGAVDYQQAKQGTYRVAAIPPTPSSPVGPRVP